MCAEIIQKFPQKVAMVVCRDNTKFSSKSSNYGWPSKSSYGNKKFRQYIILISNDKPHS